VQILAEILKFSKKNSQAVIVVLLGLVASGGIVGGMWVAMLKGAIADKTQTIEELRKLEAAREAVQQQRLAVAEAEWKIEMRETRVAIEKLRGDIARLSADTKQLEGDVKVVDGLFEDHLQRDDAQIAALQRLVKARPGTSGQLALIASELELNVQLAKAGKARANEWIRWTAERINRLSHNAVIVSESASPPTTVETTPAPPSYRTPWLSILLLITGVLLTSALVIWLIRNRRAPA